MGDDVTASIKRTQEQLGKFLKKPPLTEKNLTRPPFRFLHDIVQNVITQTGFMDGVFTPEELDAANVTSREAKTAFMQKLIQAIKDKTGDDVPIKVSKILAGLEADKTNGLLQSLAKGIEAHQQEGGGAPPSKKGSGGKKPGATQAAGKSKGAAASKGDAKKTGAGSKGAAASDKKDGGSGGTKRTVRDPSPAGKPATKQGKTAEAPSSSSGSKGRSKPVKPQASVDPVPLVPMEATVPESLVSDETGNKEEVRVAVEKTVEPSAGKSDLEEDVNLDKNGANIDNNNHDDNGNVDFSVDNFSDASALLLPQPTPNMQTLPPPTTPLLTDADAVNATMTPPLPTTPNKSMSLTPTPGPSLTPSPSPLMGAGRGRPPSGAAAGPRSLSREASAASIGEIRPPTGQQQQVRSRPDTGTSGRLTSARPPSARRAPPRPKSSVVREEAEPYRPTTGKVAHVIMDNTEDPDDDDDNYVVREVTVTSASKPPGLSDLDETPELGGGMGGTGEIDILPPDQRGLLVHQIIETQKELEDKGKGEEPMIEKKIKELSLAEIDKLKNLIQICARSANPLAKLLDYMAEDVDAMQKEYNAYREESKRLSLELDKAKGETDKFLQGLKHDLTELERKIKDKQDGILASQMKIIQQEERIEEIVMGFERVRSGKGQQGAKEHMPSAEDILAHIQGQGGAGIGSGFGSGGGPPSTFTFSSVGGNAGSTPSSAQSGGQEGEQGFKIQDSFMARQSNDEGVSPFSRGRMWANNNTFDVMDEEDDRMGSGGVGGGAGGFGGGRRSVGRSGGGGSTGGGFRRSATTVDGPAGNAMDVDSFNPWS